ncbi:MAG: hypothetical protein EOP06_19585 [Proteobacteria bacterium]|nr:MAG: hypothetical protein EOP06_19585 [Pseudomonadota bacterium]
MIDHLENLNGAPIWNFAPDETRPEGHAARLALDWEDYDSGQKWLDLFAQFLEEGDVDNLEGLIVGPWDFESSENSASIVESLVSARERLPRLRALFIGDITSEENEISWIQQSDLSPLLNAFPELEVLGARGGTDLFFGAPNHPKLKVLIAESGGLDGRLVRALMTAELPALEHLELYVGTENYGGTTTIEDLAPLLAGEVFPSLKYLGLRDYDRVDELAAAIANAPILSRIEKLDLSLGTLTDEGAQKLLDSPLVGQLKKLDLHHHFCSTEMMEHLQSLPVEVDVSEQNKVESWDGQTYRYCAVTE